MEKNNNNNLLLNVEYEEIMWKRIESLSSEMNQTDLADILGYSDPSSLSRAKNKKRKISVQNVIKLAKLFNVSTDYLLGLTDFEGPYNKKEPDVKEYILRCWILVVLNLLPEGRRKPFMENLMEKEI